MRSLIHALTLLTLLIVAACNENSADQPTQPAQRRSSPVKASDDVSSISAPTAGVSASSHDPSAQDIALLAEMLAAESSATPGAKDDFFTPGFRAATFDLDADGTTELLVRFEGLGHCGSGGCALRVYQRDGETLRKVSGTTLTFLPIGVLDSSNEGWRDLAVAVRADYVEGGRARLRYRDGRYPLSTNEPTDQAGTTVLSDQSPVNLVD